MFGKCYARQLDYSASRVELDIQKKAFLEQLHCDMQLNAKSPGSFLCAKRIETHGTLLYLHLVDHKARAVQLLFLRCA